MGGRKQKLHFSTASQSQLNRGRVPALLKLHLQPCTNINNTNTRLFGIFDLMYISYFDESGDEGYPGSSPLFVLTSLYMHYEHWKENYECIINFRRKIKAKYGMPVKQEFHTKEFITDKNPYHGIYSPLERKKILFNFSLLSD